MFYPYDNSQKYPFDNEGPGDTLWELGLDFTVSPGKTGFRGAEEHYRLKGKERFKIFGVLLEGKEPADEGAPVYRDGKKVGVVTCAMYSPLVQEIDGHRPARCRLRRPGHQARDPQQERRHQARPPSRFPSTIRRRPSGTRKAEAYWRMAAKSIISRPVYGTLSPQPGKHHLFVADAEGALAIIDLARQGADGFFADAHISSSPAMRASMSPRSKR